MRTIASGRIRSTFRNLESATCHHGGRGTAGGCVAWWGWLLLAWLVFAVVLAIGLGGVIRTAEGHERGGDGADERLPAPDRAHERSGEGTPVREVPVHGVPRGRVRPGGGTPSCEAPGRTPGRTPRSRRRRAR